MITKDKAWAENVDNTLKEIVEYRNIQRKCLEKALQLDNKCALCKFVDNFLYDNRYKKHEHIFNFKTPEFVGPPSPKRAHMLPGGILNIPIGITCLSGI